MPRRDERPEEWLGRLDEMLGEANGVARLGLSITFQSWMLLSLLQLIPKKWAELLKGLHHRLPANRVEHLDLQQAILREKVLENSIFDFSSHARNVAGASGSRGGSYFSSDDLAEPRPLHMCLGDPGGHGSVATDTQTHRHTDTQTHRHRHRHRHRHTHTCLRARSHGYYLALP